MPDTKTYVFQNEASLVRRNLYPVVTDADLFEFSSALNPSDGAPITVLSDFQTKINAAWVVINLKLITKGKRPWLVMSATALRMPHIYLTLALIYEDLAIRLESQHGEMAKHYRKLYEESWSQLTFVYDADNDGKPETKRTSAIGSIWLLGRG